MRLGRQRDIEKQIDDSSRRKMKKYADKLRSSKEGRFFLEEFETVKRACAESLLDVKQTPNMEAVRFLQGQYSGANLLNSMLETFDTLYDNLNSKKEE